MAGSSAAAKKAWATRRRGGNWTAKAQMARKAKRSKSLEPLLAASVHRVATKGRPKNRLAR